MFKNLPEKLVNKATSIPQTAVIFEKLVGGERLNRFMQSEDAAITDTVMVAVTAAISLIIGIFVFASVQNAMPQMSGEAGAAVANIAHTTFTAFNLLTISLIVLAAATIMGALFYR